MERRGRPACRTCRGLRRWARARRARSRSVHSQHVLAGGWLGGVGHHVGNGVGVARVDHLPGSEWGAGAVGTCSARLLLQAGGCAGTPPGRRRRQGQLQGVHPMSSRGAAPRPILAPPRVPLHLGGAGHPHRQAGAAQRSIGVELRAQVEPPPRECVSLSQGTACQAQCSAPPTHVSVVQAVVERPEHPGLVAQGGLCLRDFLTAQHRPVVRDARQSLDQARSLALAWEGRCRARLQAMHIRPGRKQRSTCLRAFALRGSARAGARLLLTASATGTTRASRAHVQAMRAIGARWGGRLSAMGERRPRAHAPCAAQRQRPVGRARGTRRI